MSTVSSRMVVRVVRLASAYGLDGGALADAAGVDRATLADPDGRVAVARSDELIERVDALAGDPAIGVRLAATREASTYDAAGLVLLAAPTLRVGLARAFRSQVLWGDGDRFAIERDVITFDPGGPHRRAHEIVTECALVEVIGAVRALVDPAGKALRVRLRYDAGARAAALGALFGCDVAIRAQTSAIALSSEHLDARIPPGPLESLGILAPRADASFATSVRAVLSCALIVGQASIVGVARRFAISPRTLQRRLASEGATFEALADDARRALSSSLLGKGLAIAEIVTLSGYSDKAAFYRAYRRWTGTTPRSSGARRSPRPPGRRGRGAGGSPP